MCHGFKLPDDDNYHVIATTPILDVSAIVHHIILYMCESWQGNGRPNSVTSSCDEYTRLDRDRHRINFNV